MSKFWFLKLGQSWSGGAFSWGELDKMWWEGHNCATLVFILWDPWRGRTDCKLQINRWVWKIIGWSSRLQKIINHFRGIYEIYLELTKKKWKIITCNRLDLETLGFWPIMPHKSHRAYCLGLDPSVTSLVNILLLTKWIAWFQTLFGIGWIEMSTHQRGGIV